MPHYEQANYAASELRAEAIEQAEGHYSVMCGIKEISNFYGTKDEAEIALHNAAKDNRNQSCDLFVKIMGDWKHIDTQMLSGGHQ